MHPANIQIVRWQDSSLPFELVNTSEEDWYTHLRYRGPSDERIDVATIPKRPAIQHDQSGGVLATSFDDSMRVASNFAVDQAYERQPNRDAFRSRAVTIIDESSERANWTPQALSIDHASVQGLVRVLPEGTWAVVAELNHSFLAVGGPIEIGPAALTFTSTGSGSG